MSQQMTLQEALQEIEKLRAENEKLKAEIKQLNEALDEKVEYDDTIYPEAETEDEAEWFDLKDDSDYEIKNIYPYEIRRKSNEKIIGEGIEKKSGYIRIHLGKKCYSKHILVAKHFIPNPEHLPIVDHINHHRDDYHTTNLRWVSAKDNSRNKSSCNGVVYEYVDTIPDDSMKVDTYGKHTFDDYYFYDNIFYFYNGINYRKLHINENKCGNKYVSLISEEGNRVSVMYSKFKREHDIPIE
ncbi:hypothetical protein M9Y10_037184 [Tritrichomonas musculus]|uniref:HNH nuclease domain-containing protein n=1 Tax=Tritrichomonas musculus TaxID=1915356 RepID=A0ABR2GT60_9EUKA